MQIKEGHYYELINGELGTARVRRTCTTSTCSCHGVDYPWNIAGHRLTDDGHYWADGLADSRNVKREVLIIDVPVPWWEREGIEEGDLVRTHNRRLWQVADIDDHGVLIYFADSNTISWPLLEKDFQCKFEMKEVPRAH